MFNVDVKHAIVNHMNEDHADAVLAYAQAFTEFGTVRSAHMQSIDEDGIDIECDYTQGTASARIYFPTPLSSASEARNALIKLAGNARAVVKLKQMLLPTYSPLDRKTYHQLTLACEQTYWLKIDINNDISLSGQALSIEKMVNKGDWLMLDVSRVKVKIRVDIISGVTTLEKSAQAKI